MVLGITYGAAWTLIPDQMKPFQSMFGLVITILLCIAAEALIIKVPLPKGFPPIPPLLGEFTSVETNQFVRFGEKGKNIARCGCMQVVSKS